MQLRWRKGSTAVDGKKNTEATQLLKRTHLEMCSCVYQSSSKEFADLSELGLNPIFALPEVQRCRIVDARIRIGKNPVEAQEGSVMSFQASGVALTLTAVSAA